MNDRTVNKTLIATLTGFQKKCGKCTQKKRDKGKNAICTLYK